MFYFDDFVLTVQETESQTLLEMYLKSVINIHMMYMSQVQAWQLKSSSNHSAHMTSIYFQKEKYMEQKFGFVTLNSF